MDVWKENILEDFELGNLEYKTAEEFLVDLKKEFGGGDKEVVKVVELRKLEQKGRAIEEFVQEFRRATRESSYEERLLVEEFKREISRVIRKKLMEAERPLTSIEQWYKHATNLDRHLRESRREKERLRRRKSMKAQALRQSISAKMAIHGR